MLRPVLRAPWPAGLETGGITAGLANEPNTSDTGQYTHYNDFGTFSIGSGVATFSHTSGHTHFVKTGSDLASGKFLITCDATARSVVGTPGFLNSGVGIVKDFSNLMLADYDHILGQCRIAYFVGGVGTFLGGTSLTLTIPYSVALACDGGKRVQMWVKTSGVWRFVTSGDVSADFAWGSFSFTGWKAGFGASCPNQSSWSFDNLKAAQRFR